MTKIKFFKFFTQIFVVKQEKEIEIGFPTDVKHVAHIGWDGPSGTSAPTWMNDFKSPPDFSTTTSANPKTSPDYDQSTQEQSAPAAFDRNQPSDPGSAPRKPRRKKKTTTTDASQKSPPKSKRSRQAKTKSNETMPKTDLKLEV